LCITPQVFSFILFLSVVFSPLTTYLLDKNGLPASLIVMAVVSFTQSGLLSASSAPPFHIAAICVSFMKFFFFCIAPAVARQVFVLSICRCFNINKPQNKSMK